MDGNFSLNQGALAQDDTPKTHQKLRGKPALGALDQTPRNQGLACRPKGGRRQSVPIALQRLHALGSLDPAHEQIDELIVNQVDLAPDSTERVIFGRLPLHGEFSPL
jgi:hypothetical protein